jgi:SAM-dependent methyltransferase
MPVRDGVVHASTGLEDPAIERERQAVLDIETGDPPSGPTEFSMHRLLAGPGPLRTAFLALPHDDGSAFFRDNEYFRNVSQFAATFEDVVRRLDLPPGSRVLDVGADLTWSTARLTRRGWRGVAIDINHHLAAARVFREHGLVFPAVNVDMHAPVFADGVFDGILAVNALHHTHRLQPLVANLARVLRPGGRLGFIEPYWFHEETRSDFGAAQIEAGINENVYRLEEWHQAFVNHGLEPVTFVAAASFHGIYEKRAAGLAARTLTIDEARDDLFARFYQVSFTAPLVVGPVRPGEALTIPVTVHNRSQAGWCIDSQIPVFLSYHLRAATRAADGGMTDTTVIAFDNARTGLPGHLNPASDTVVALDVTAPEQPGTYWLDVDLVHEGITWFADRGGKTATVALRVDAPRPA